MKKYGRSAEPPSTNEGSLDDFLRTAEAKIKYTARFLFTNTNGSEEWISTATACEAVRRLTLFFSSPEHIESMTLNDGRMIVASHNLASLTQHLRWACGLDADSKPHPKSSGYVHPKTHWPLTAQLWFWSNGGPPMERETGTYQHWLKFKTYVPDKAQREITLQPEVRTLPEVHECEVVG
ncbi:MAG: hypothetical protein WC718_16065 [Phycisphaerales bacterium]